MSILVFLDTETTGLSLDDDIWEFAAIRREADGSQTEHHLFVEHETTKCARLPESFRADHRRRFPISHGPDWDKNVHSRRGLADAVVGLTSDRPHIVGAVPNFDTERLAILLRRYALEPAWHYHLIDVENLAVGWIHGKYGTKDEAEARAVALPWDSDDLSRACGVEPPGEGERHTALGDARWAMRLYDAITAKDVSA